jgi:hypothetical protein
VASLMQRAECAREVYEKVYDETESFAFDEIGLRLAYLLGGLLTGRGYAAAADDALVEILKRHFDAGHPVWGFVTYGEGV